MMPEIHGRHCQLLMMPKAHGHHCHRKLMLVIVIMVSCQRTESDGCCFIAVVLPVI